MAMPNDQEYDDVTISTVEGNRSDDCFHVSFDSGYSLMVSNENHLPPPKPGQRARVYSRGLGYHVRGFATEHWTYYYETKQVHAARTWRELKEGELEDARAFEENLEDWNRRVEALPEALRDRIRYFEDGVAGWGPRFGRYELYCCEEAAKIVRALVSPSAVQEYALSHPDPESKGSVPDLDSGHSGNTFGTSCALAMLVAAGASSSIIARTHGAMCSLVGCEEYGCHAARAAPNPATELSEKRG